MKLWVDDVRDAPDDSWTIARTSEEAIRYLARMPFKEISLDHDDEASLSRQETFQPVAYFIGEKYYTHKRLDRDFDTSEWSTPQMAIARLSLYPKITIHSVNPVGAKQMQDILKDYGIDATLKPYQ